MVDGEGLTSVSPKGYRTTATVLHMATPAGWTKNGGERAFIDALQKLMNAGSPTLTGPGGALILGLFIRTEDKGVMEPEIEQLRKEYPIGELAEFRHIARMRWEAYAQACNQYEGAVTPEQGKLAELRISLGQRMLADLMPHVLGIDPTGNDQEPCATCSGRGCPECREKFSFTTRAGEEPSVYEAVFQALGAASACWENLAGAGIFNSTRAKEIGDYLREFISSRLESAYEAGKQAEAEKAEKAKDPDGQA